MNASPARTRVRVIVVEPGAFRTDFSGRSLMQSTERIADYDDTAGRRRKENEDVDGRQPGDPARGARAIVRTVEAERPPFRLLLGSDAVRIVGAELEVQMRELEAWKDTSTDYPDGD